jgi:hypothetical protein
MSDDNTQGAGEPSPASAGSHGDESPLFSERFKMAHAAYEWCRDNHASLSAPENIVTALFALGLVVKRPALTYEEREAVAWASTADWGSNPHAATLRGLLERLK